MKTDWDVPEYLQRDELRIWVLWHTGFKRACAPWENNGVMREAIWKKEVKDRPERSYDEVIEYMEEYEAELLDPDNYDFSGFEPEDPIDPEEVRPTVLLPHRDRWSGDWPDHHPAMMTSNNRLTGERECLMFLDLDDVHNPETGETLPEAEQIIDRLDCYTEWSRSKTGFHCWFLARLPPGDKVLNESFDTDPIVGDDMPGVEMYNFARFTGSTWNHIEDTPMTVPERQEELGGYGDGGEGILADYDFFDPDDLEDWDPDELTGSGSGSSSDTSLFNDIEDVFNTMNPFYDADIMDIVRSTDFSKHGSKSSGGEIHGPNPGHGAQAGSKWNKQSTNTTINPSDNVWWCRIDGHGGGGPLTGAAITIGVADCGNANQIIHDPSSPSDYVAVYKACKHIKESGAVDPDAEYPYNAMVGHYILENGLENDSWRDMQADPSKYKPASSMERQYRQFMG